MSYPALHDRHINTYHRICVEWDEHNGGVNSYLADAITITPGTGVVEFTAEAWNWSSEPDGGNAREYFDDPQRMAIPLGRVKEIYWPTETAATEEK